VEGAARSTGVSIRTNAPVSGITVRDDAIVGVVLDGGEEIAAPIVISTTDPASTLLGVDPVWLDPELIRAIQNIKFRACTAFVQFAVDRLPTALAAPALASVVTLSPHPDFIQRAYDAAKYGLVSPEPHIEITSPSVRWPSLAPAGQHIITARVQYVPHTPRDGTWTEARSRDLGDQVRARISRALPGFGESVL